MNDSSNAAVTRVSAVIIPVADQDKCLAFYEGVLGLEKRSDVPFTPDGGRWIELAPKGADTPIAICPPGPDNEPGGKETGIGLETGDIDAYHAHLKDKGVDVDDEVGRFGDPVPPTFWFRDPEGNSLMVVEPAK